MEHMIDVIVNSTVNDKQLKTLSWVLCIDMKPLCFRVR